MSEPTDSMLDDPLYRRDVAEEERRTFEDEVDQDEARADQGLDDD